MTRPPDAIVAVIIGALLAAIGYLLVRIDDNSAKIRIIEYQVNEQILKEK